MSLRVPIVPGELEIILKSFSSYFYFFALFQSDAFVESSPCMLRSGKHQNSGGSINWIRAEWMKDRTSIALPVIEWPRQLGGEVKVICSWHFQACFSVYLFWASLWYVFCVLSIFTNNAIISLRFVNLRCSITSERQTLFHCVTPF